MSRLRGHPKASVFRVIILDRKKQRDFKVYITAAKGKPWMRVLLWPSGTPVKQHWPGVLQ